MKRIAIIGAGASGLFLAKKWSGREGGEVYVFERSRQVGTKLRASGGGKCNLFNTSVLSACYNHPEFASKLLEKVSPQRLWHEFEEMGLQMVADEEGRVYPLSQFSQTVVDVLSANLEENIHFEMGYEVRKVFSQDGLWRINDYPVPFDNVVFASGTPANMIPRNRKDYNDYLKDFNITVNEFQPSLVGFVIKDYPKKLSGCRVKVIASLYQGEKLIHSEPGEVTFKDDGISGIVILNLSAYYNRLKDKSGCFVELNFLYANPDYDVQAHLRKYHSLRGLLHPKLNALYEREPFDVKKFKMEIEGLYDLAFAQVCHGGIALDEVDDRFALKKYPGIYVTGEMLDLDGICGGYNLFFAFASALLVAEG
ncbi:MAG: NAD(P)/FAD-dependent oxidoreductase [Bacteroidales bacterium]|nr:NAD(P)/FAD-dependent oxidoreductase [Bacteroidales bacterium]